LKVLRRPVESTLNPLESKSFLLDLGSYAQLGN
jgi:hypothetical protein